MGVFRETWPELIIMVLCSLVFTLSLRLLRRR